MLFRTLHFYSYCKSALPPGSSSSPETQVLGESSFLQRGWWAFRFSQMPMSLLQVCAPGAKAPHAWLSTELAEAGDNSCWQWQANGSQCKSTLMHSAASWPSKWSSPVVNFIFFSFLSIRKKSSPSSKYLATGTLLPAAFSFILPKVLY